VSERTLWKLTKSGDVPCVQIGRSVRYDARSLDQWIRARETSRSTTTSSTSRRRVDGEHQPRSQRPSGHSFRSIGRHQAEDPAGQGHPETGRGGQGSR
ncbi:MAG: hypothetical protein CMJ68_18815, partial [Planctomycetaceae bacterium]|nr:hypothetical protein [Planctomycetaceae bacterium]